MNVCFHISTYQLGPFLTTFLSVFTQLVSFTVPIPLVTTISHHTFIVYHTLVFTTEPETRAYCVKVGLHLLLKNDPISCNCFKLQRVALSGQGGLGKGDNPSIKPPQTPINEEKMIKN